MPALEPEDTDALVAANVRALREARGWSQSELARRVAERGVTSMHQTTIARIEASSPDQHEKRRPVRLAEAVAIASVLDVSLKRLVSVPDEEEWWMEGGHDVERQWQAIDTRLRSLADEIAAARIKTREHLQSMPTSRAPNTMGALFVAKYFEIELKQIERSRGDELKTAIGHFENMHDPDREEAWEAFWRRVDEWMGSAQSMLDRAATGSVIDRPTGGGGGDNGERQEAP